MAILTRASEWIFMPTAVRKSLSDRGDTGKAWSKYRNSNDAPSRMRTISPRSMQRPTWSPSTGTRTRMRIRSSGGSQSMSK